jgi:hypothetical protein
MKSALGEPSPNDGVSQPVSHPWLSLLLFFHLFSIAVALGANHFPSPLQSRMAGFMSPYLRVMNFDISFIPYHLTLGTVDDQDHRIDVLAADAYLMGDEGWIGIGEPSFRGGERFKRFQRLAATMAFFGERRQDQLSALFARAVAEHFLNQRHIEPSEIRCRRILPQDRSAVAGGTPEQRNPLSSLYFAEVYRASALIDGSTVAVIKVEQAGHVARPDAGGRSP